MRLKPLPSAAWLVGALLTLPAQSHAAACPTTTLDQILAIGTCTIGDQSFDFIEPLLLGKPVYFNGPFAGNTGLAPGAADVVFTPSIGADGAGFSLSGDFEAFGAASRYDPFSGRVKVGNYYDAFMGYFGVTAGTGKGLSGYSISLIGADVSTGTDGSFVYADLNSARAYRSDSDPGQLSDSYSFASLILGRQRFVSNIKTYDYSANPADFARFDSIRYEFSQQAITPVPEPGQWTLMLAGLAVAATLARRRRR
jgi:hypothetical protein